MFTLFWLMFPRKSLPEGGTYCREIQFQQSKGPGMYSGKAQTREVQPFSGWTVVLGWCLGRGSSLPAPLLPREELGVSSADPLDAAGFNLPGTAELFVTGLPAARTEPFWICCSGGFPFRGSVIMEKENWLIGFAVVYGQLLPLKWYQTSPRCEL